MLGAVALSPVKFERIHPFKDGNGRSGRCLLNSQCQAIYGSKNDRLFDRTSYLAAMKSRSMTYTRSWCLLPYERV